MRNSHKKVDSTRTVKRTTGENVPSWPYDDVWRTSKVLRLVILLAGLTSFVSTLCIFLANPYVSPIGANTIDHFTDPRWFAKESSEEWTALAYSDPWIALGTGARGLVLVNTHSRLSRDELVTGRIIDLTNGMRPGSFFVLSEEQSIRQVTPGMGPLGALIDQSTWLPAPKNLWWLGHTDMGKTTILANEIDEQGWLLVGEGRGVARYRLIREPDGRLVRTRSWQTGPLSDVDVTHAVLVSNGAWLALQNGGIKFADRESLKEVEGHNVETPPIRTLDASYTEEWASAQDNADGLWIYSKTIGKWLGPFFGHGPSEKPRLDSLREVTIARAQESIVWMATRNHLFCYDKERRRLRSVPLDIAPTMLEPEPASATASGKSVLVAGNTGLYSVTEPESIIGFQSNQIDKEPVSSIGVSGDGQTCVYLVNGHEMRVVTSPFSGGHPTTFLPHEGWRQLADVPTILNVRRTDDGVLFITSAGAFYYNDRHEYIDGSRSYIPAVPERNLDQTTEMLDSITHLNETDGQVVVISNDQPHVLNTRASPGKPLWTGLDPMHTSHPAQVTQAARCIFGQGRDGRVYCYNGTIPTAYPSVDDGDNPLRNWPQPGNTVNGDLAINPDGSWHNVFLYRGNVISYESESGQVTGRPLPPACQSEGSVVQLRLVGKKKIVYLLNDGSLLDSNGNLLFGGSSMPFPPAQATLLGRGTDNDSILVGGPTNQLLRYRWTDGSWRSVGGGSFAGGAEARVDEAFDMGDSVFARLSKGGVFHSYGKGWSVIPGCRRVFFNPAGPDGWGLFDNGLQRINGQSGAPHGPRYCAGLGDTNQVDRWTYAWQPDASLLTLFTNGSDYGAYDVSTDSWSTGSLVDAKAPRLFTQFQSSMTALDGRRLLHVKLDHRCDVMATVQDGADRLSLASNGDHLWLSYVENGTPVVRVWQNLHEQSGEYRRGGNPLPPGFDPSAAILAVADESSALLCDITGQCVRYDVTSGRWARLRKPVAGQAVYGWINDPQPALLLTTQTGATVLATFQHDRGFIETVYPVSPETLLQREEWREANLVQPTKGLLLSMPYLRVMRTDGRTTYEVGSGDSWMPLRPTARGFAEDSATSLVVTPSGRIWTLQDGLLFELAISASTNALYLTGVYFPTDATDITLLQNGQLQTLGPSGVVTWSETDTGLQPAAGPSNPVLASMAISGCTVDWVWSLSDPRGRSNGTVRTVRRDGKPARFTKAGRLDFQTVKDISVADGQLLLATPNGTVVRDATNFALVQVDQGAVPVNFVRAFGPDRVLVRCEDGTLREWSDTSVSKVDRRGTPQALTRLQLGSVVWQADLSGTRTAGISLAHASDGHIIPFIRSSAEWRPVCDVVNSLRQHVPASLNLVLCSEEDSWPFNMKSGRGYAPVAGDLPSDMVSGGNAAIKVTRDGRNVTFESADGGPAWVEGHLFYESGKGLAGYAKAIYVLIAGRGILRRDAMNPSEITGFWPLDHRMPNGQPNLESGANGIRLTFSHAGPWDLVVEENSARWQPACTTPQPVRVLLGPVTWRTQTGSTHCFRPYVMEQGQERVLNDWWCGDRFAWDHVTSVGALNNRLVVAATPVGLVSCPNGNSSFYSAGLWPKSGVTRLISACRDGHQVGLLADGPSGRYLITPGEDQSPIHVSPAGELAFDRNRRVFIERITTSNSRPYVRMIERWDTGDPFVPNDGPVIRCTMTQLSPGNLLRDGQFVFDYGQTGCPILDASGKETNLWAVFASAAGHGIITLNEVKRNPTTGESRFVLCDFIAAPIEFRNLRTCGTGFLALDANGSWWKATVHDGGINWSRNVLVANREALRTGDQVTVDVANLNWNASPTYLGDGQVPLVILPTEYSLFVDEAGAAALAFDVATSVSVDWENRRIALGTQGGVFEGQFCNDGAELLLGRDARTMFTFNFTRSHQAGRLAPRDWVLNVQRVRYDSEGVLYARFGTNGRIAWLMEGGAWYIEGEQLPDEQIDGAQRPVSVDAQGLRIDDKYIPTSNDLFWFERRPITDIVGHAFDADRQTLWLCGRREGLFKVILDRVPR
jgi:hypothetical protein